MLGWKNDSHEPKMLELDASLQGNLVFKEHVNLSIKGCFEGRLETKGDLVIGERAMVRAELVCERITVSGKVTGDITASAEVRLTHTAQVIGDIQTPSLIAEKGAVLQGMARMLSIDEGASVSRKICMSTEEVAHYLSVERDLVSEWAENGKLPGSKNGVGWQFDKEKVDEWIANGRIT